MWYSDRAVSLCKFLRSINCGLIICREESLLACVMFLFDNVVLLQNSCHHCPTRVHIQLTSFPCFESVYLSYSLSYSNKHMLIFLVWIIIHRQDRERLSLLVGVRQTTKNKYANRCLNCWIPNNNPYNIIQCDCRLRLQSWKKVHLSISGTFTCKSFPLRDGRVHCDGSTDPARSDGGRIGGGDDAGHGQLPVCGLV